MLRCGASHALPPPVTATTTTQRTRCPPLLSSARRRRRRPHAPSVRDERVVLVAVFGHPAVGRQRREQPAVEGVGRRSDGVGGGRIERPAVYCGLDQREASVGAPRLVASQVCGARSTTDRSGSTPTSKSWLPNVAKSVPTPRRMRARARPRSPSTAAPVRACRRCQGMKRLESGITVEKSHNNPYQSSRRLASVSLAVSVVS